MNDVVLDDAMLSASGQYLATAAQIIAGGGPAPEVQMRSATGVAGEVKTYLRGLVLAQLALSDAAKTGCLAAGRMMTESDELDRRIAASLGSGYRVPPGRSWP